MGKALRRGVPTLACIALVAVVIRAIVSLPVEEPGLADAMRSAAESSGIANVVTAVLLDFRGYDTLLEIAVLMLATVAVLSLRDAPDALTRPIAATAGPVLGSLTRALVPVMFVVAVHLVWVGAYGPGGAFQGGAVLGAAGILLALSGFARPRWAEGVTVRAVLAAGLLTFIAIALLPLADGGTLLQYPPEWKKPLLLTLEVLLTVSIGASLTSLFLASAAPDRDGGRR